VVEAVGLTVSLGVRTGVALGSELNPGSEPVRVVGVFIDLKAIREIKIPAPNTVINKIKYNGTLFIIFNVSISENHLS
jgi:hypothetical protein